MKKEYPTKSALSVAVGDAIKCPGDEYFRAVTKVDKSGDLVKISVGMEWFVVLERHESIEVWPRS